LTRWSPDTCKCIIDNYKTFFRRCRIHQTATVDQVMDHNRSFSVNNYNLPKVAWHIAKMKAFREDVLTPDEIDMFARKQKMLQDKAAEKRST